MSDPFIRLVKLAGRAFYDDVTMKGENQPKNSRSDNRGIAVVVLDALTRRQWVREEDLAKDLKIHTKQLRRTLRFFEEEKLITRDHRKETAKGAKLYSAAVAVTTEGQQIPKEGDEKVKLHTHSYCCLDYAQIHDVVRYRIHRMRKKLKDELDNKNTVQEYLCPKCGKRYNALDALQLISFEDEYFHCENCNGELVAESDSVTAQEGDGDDKGQRCEKVKDMLQKLEVQLKPLVDHLNILKDLPAPPFITLQEWENHARIHLRSSNGDSSSNDPSKFSQGSGGTSMPFLGETKIEVNLKGEKIEDSKPDAGSSGLKVLPPWMIKQGMNLTKEQRGEVKEETKMDDTSIALNSTDDKKLSMENPDERTNQNEYAEQYYAAFLQAMAKQQQELSQVPTANPSPERQVGEKMKREKYEEDDGVDWQDAPFGGNTSEGYKVNDLNVEAQASGDDEDEDDFWEDG